MSERVLALLVRRRILVALAAVALTVLSLVGAGRVAVESSIEIWFLEGDASLERYHAFRDTFGVDEFVLVVFEGEDALTPEGLAAIERVRAGAADHPLTSRTRWLTAGDVVQSVDDMVHVGPLTRDLPADAPGARDLLARARATPLLEGIVAGERPVTAVLVELSEEGRDLERKVELISALRGLLAEHAADLDATLTGPPAFDETFFQKTQRDFGLLGPAALAVVVVVCLIAFRRLGLALAPLVVVFVAVSWTLGLMGLLGLKINVVSSSLVSVVLAIGVADGIHLVRGVLARLREGLDRERAVVTAFAQLLTPCLVTTGTTMLGMLSLTLSEIRPIREFGVLAALGVGLALLASYLLGPALLTWAAPDPATLRADEGPLLRVLDRLGSMRRRTAVVVALVGTVTLVGLGSALPRLEVGVNPVKYFRADEPIRANTQRIDDVLGGTASVELVVRAPDRGFDDPAVVARVAALQAVLEREPGVSYSRSIADPLREIHHAWGEGRQLPEDEAALAQFYLLLDGSPDVAPFLDADHETGRISLRTKMSMVDAPMEAIDRVRAHAAQASDERLQVEVTGYVHLMSTMYEYLLSSQIQSLALAFVVVSLAMLLVLRSWRLALLAMIPNLLPLAAGLGLMAWLGIALDVGTVMIGSIAMGLVVDDTVHLLVALRRGLETHPVDEALRQALRESGGALVVTTFALGLGFGVLAFGSFLANVYFGLICGAIIFLALLCDVVLLPAVLRLVGRRLFATSSTEARRMATEKHRKTPNLFARV